MGSYVSLLCMIYNIHICKENQSANLSPFGRNVCIYLVATN